MPVILDTACWDIWIDPETHDANALQALLQPCPADALTAWPVSMQVNNPRHDTPDCQERLA